MGRAEYDSCLTCGAVGCICSVVLVDVAWGRSVGFKAKAMQNSGGDRIRADIRLGATNMDIEGMGGVVDVIFASVRRTD